MNITYKDTHDFTVKDLESLFLSVDWSSGHFPEKLQKAMHGFQTVYSAWDGDTLAGMVCAMDDGIMNAYVHYLLLRPEYQHIGIGKELMQRINSHYKDYLRIVVIAYNKEIGFYEHCSFEKSEVSTPMFNTKLWT
ncbi:MAG: GNAT family N-acetyltransferase [Oscillospiraceae bacterium]|nr:GNAT family N-acetyltransferase [Oscillospiraceae bacterium]